MLLNTIRYLNFALQLHFDLLMYCKMQLKHRICRSQHNATKHDLIMFMSLHTEYTSLYRHTNYNGWISQCTQSANEVKPNIFRFHPEQNILFFISHEMSVSHATSCQSGTEQQLFYKASCCRSSPPSLCPQPQHTNFNKHFPEAFCGNSTIIHALTVHLTST